jgi:hypothetical protein
MQALRGEAMNICRHCGKAIIEFEFIDNGVKAKKWWHFSGTPHLYCVGNKTVAEP